MKFTAFSLALALTHSSALAAGILAGEAAGHIGETATVEGLTTEVKVSRGGTTFVDIDGAYPSQTFTAGVRERCGRGRRSELVAGTYCRRHRHDPPLL